VVLLAVLAWAALLQWAAATAPLAFTSPKQPAPGQEGTDLQLFRAVVARVAAGEDYYAVNAAELPPRGFPTDSVFNWRLPTYAWLLALLGSGFAARLVCVLVVAAALLASVKAVLDQLGLYAAAAFFLLQCGVAGHLVVEHGRFTTEVWAAVLILLSVGATGCGWRWVAVAAGLAALFFRELAGWYVVVAAANAAYERRWREVAAWAAGVAAFLTFFAWHAWQVTEHRPANDFAGPSWLAFGGLRFDMLCCRLNAWLTRAPWWVLAAYLAAATAGFLAARTEMLRVAAAAAVGYLALFAVVGRPENNYWGLIPAPLLAFGVVLAPVALRDLLAAGYAGSSGGERPPKAAKGRQRPPTGGL
jgi:hypothetical protein